MKTKQNKLVKIIKSNSDKELKQILKSENELNQILSDHPKIGNILPRNLKFFTSENKRGILCGLFFKKEEALKLRMLIWNYVDNNTSDLNGHYFAGFEQVLNPFSEYKNEYFYCVFRLPLKVTEKIKKTVIETKTKYI